MSDEQNREDRFLAMQLVVQLPHETARAVRVMALVDDLLQGWLRGEPRAAPDNLLRLR